MILSVTGYAVTLIEAEASVSGRDGIFKNTTAGTRSITAITSEGLSLDSGRSKNSNTNDGNHRSGN
jgi:hypothetical protein